MKTTVELDETKVKRLMDFTGIGTLKEALDWALTEALRIATLNRIAEHPWTAEEAKAAVDPAYDILAIRRGSVRYSVGARKKSGK